MKEFDINIDSLNPDVKEMSLIGRVRPCKSIRPINNNAVCGYNGNLPRIVRSDFKVPPNWYVVEKVTEGQVLEDKSRWGERFVHICDPHKRWDKCIRGFWAIRQTS